MCIKLSPIILKILELKALNAKNSNEKNDADRKFKEFTNSYNDSIKNAPAKLSEGEIVELKKRFKEASKLCHPDLVDENDKEKASLVFIELKQAYDLNDLNTVSSILKDLNDGLFKSNLRPVNDKANLSREIQKIRKGILKIEEQLQNLIQSEIYLNISGAGNWDDYFENKKKELQNYFNDLKKVE